MNRILVVAFWNAALLGIIIIAAELIFGTWFTGINVANLKIPANHITDTDSSHLFPEGRRFIFNRDKFGLRGTHNNVEDIKLLALGGSTTAQTNTPDGLTWTDLLEQKLSVDIPNIKIGNAGVDGHSTFAHLIYIKLWLPSIKILKPRAIIYFIGINDVARSSPLEGVDVTHELSAQKYYFTQRIRQNSSIYSLYKSFRWLVLNELTKVTSGTLAYGGMKAVKASDYSPVAIGQLNLKTYSNHVDNLKLKLYRKRVKELIRETNKYGAKPIIVNQTTGHVLWKNGVPFYQTRGVMGETLEKFRQSVQFARATMADCRQTKAICLNLEAAHILEPGDIYDTLHTTPSANKKIALFIANSIKDLNLN